MRKYKQVKRKEIIYGLTEWAEVERRAKSLSMRTGSYIKHISVSGQINVIFNRKCIIYKADQKCCI